MGVTTKNLALTYFRVQLSFSIIVLVLIFLDINCTLLLKNMINSKNNKIFLAPQLKPVFTRCLQSISYLVADSAYQIHLQVNPADVAKIKALGDARILYLSNHPTLDDGISFFLFSTLVGQLFHYLVARDSFQGWLAYFLPLVGCYSMRRGIGDRTSIRETIKLLQQPAMRLLIFPEGGCSYQNETVIPFRSGAVSMAFQAMNKLAKQNKKTLPIYLVPLSLKYRYIHPMNQQIDLTLSRLESAFNMKKSNEDYYQRLRNVGKKVIDKLSQEYDINEAFEYQNSRDWNEIINLLKIKMLEQCEKKLNISANTQLPIRERVYLVQANLTEILETKNENPEIKELEKYIKQTTFQILNFDAIYDGYVAEKPSQERFLDTLNRLERSVFKLNKPSRKGTRRAIIKVSNPINLVDYYQSYLQKKSETVEKLTQIIQQSVESNLQM